MADEDDILHESPSQTAGPYVHIGLMPNFSGIEVIPETEFPMGSVPMDRDETADMLVERGVDAVVVGNAS